MNNDIRRKNLMFNYKVNKFFFAYLAFPGSAFHAQGSF